MRPTPWFLVEPYRIKLPTFRSRWSRYGDNHGNFLIPYLRGVYLGVLATSGDWPAAELPEEYAWEHVSVSLPNRTPTWPEMDFVCRLFWAEDEIVMQLHVPPKENINVYPHCLHMWRPLSTAIPRPPSGAVE